MSSGLASLHLRNMDVDMVHTFEHPEFYEVGLYTERNQRKDGWNNYRIKYNKMRLQTLNALKWLKRNHGLTMCIQQESFSQSSAQSVAPGLFWDRIQTEYHQCLFTDQIQNAELVNFTNTKFYTQVLKYMSAWNLSTVPTEFVVEKSSACEPDWHEQARNWRARATSWSVPALSCQAGIPKTAGLRSMVLQLFKSEVPACLDCLPV